MGNRVIIGFISVTLRLVDTDRHIIELMNLCEYSRSGSFSDLAKVTLVKGNV